VLARINCRVQTVGGAALALVLDGGEDRVELGDHRRRDPRQREPRVHGSRAIGQASRLARARAHVEAALQARAAKSRLPRVHAAGHNLSNGHAHAPPTTQASFRSTLGPV